MYKVLLNSIVNCLNKVPHKYKTDSEKETELSVKEVRRTNLQDDSQGKP